MVRVSKHRSAAVPASCRRAGDLLGIARSGVVRVAGGTYVRRRVDRTTDERALVRAADAVDVGGLGGRSAGTGAALPAWADEQPAGARRPGAARRRPDGGGVVPPGGGGR